MGQCLRSLGISSSEPYDELGSSTLPLVTLDKRWKGKDVVLSNFTVTGTGVALCSCYPPKQGVLRGNSQKEWKYLCRCESTLKKANGSLGDNKKKVGV